MFYGGFETSRASRNERATRIGSELATWLVPQVSRPRWAGSVVTHAVVGPVLHTATCTCHSLVTTDSNCEGR
jgi:hypothetical protein